MKINWNPWKNAKRWREAYESISRTAREIIKEEVQRTDEAEARVKKLEDIISDALGCDCDTNWCTGHAKIYDKFYEYKGGKFDE